MSQEKAHSREPRDQPVILAHDLVVEAGGQQILRSIDLRVDEGEFVALLGANGSGKSTTVRALTGLMPLAGGTVDLFGVPLADFRHWQRVGYVPQRPSASSGVPTSVREVVASGRLSRRRLFQPPSRHDRLVVSEALELVHLSDRARDRVSELSGGQQQRVLIARALAGEPDLFFLDEPNAGVDFANQQSLADALGALKARGSTIVLVAHELGPLEPLVDRTVVLEEGRVLHDGPAPCDPSGHHHHHVVHQQHDDAPHFGSVFESTHRGHDH